MRKKRFSLFIFSFPFGKFRRTTRADVEGASEGREIFTEWDKAEKFSYYEITKMRRCL